MRKMNRVEVMSGAYMIAINFKTENAQNSYIGLRLPHHFEL